MIFRILLSITVILTLFSGMVCCSNSGNNAMTVLTAVNGKVQVQKYGSPNWNDAAIGMTLLKGYKIKTDNVSTASITFFDGSTIELNGGTEISLDELLSKSATSPKTIKIGQKIGATSSTIVKLVDPASRYEVDTQAGVAAVGGSKMVVTVAGDGATQVYNVEGSISFTAQGQQVNIPAGSVSSAKPGEIPGTPQPGTPPVFGAPAVTSISATTGWQQTSLYLNAGDKFYVDYRGGSWSVNINGYPYVGPAGLPLEIDKKVDSSSKIAASVPYGYLIGKVGSGNVILIGNKGGPFTADATGFLSLRINDSDRFLADNDGAITVNLRQTTINNSATTDSLRSNPPYADVPALNETIAGNAVIGADGTVNVSLSTGKPGLAYGVYIEEYKGTVGGYGNWLSDTPIGYLTTDAHGTGTFSGTEALSSGTHYLQIVLSTDSQWGPNAFGTDINKIIIK
jgi:hypothetical protein